MKTKKQTPKTGFITHTPLPGLSSHKRTNLHSKRACSGVRASTSMPPPPPPPPGEDEDNKNKNEGNDEVEVARASLEKLLGLQLKSKNGNDGQCKCIWCNGTKQRMCKWCNGRGIREEYVNKSWEELAKDIEKMQKDSLPMETPKKVPVVCSACSGSKKLRCAYCRGSGIGSYGHGY